MLDGFAGGYTSGRDSRSVVGVEDSKRWISVDGSVARVVCELGFEIQDVVQSAFKVGDGIWEWNSGLWGIAVGRK